MSYLSVPVKYDLYIRNSGVRTPEDPGLVARVPKLHDVLSYILYNTCLDDNFNLETFIAVYQVKITGNARRSRARLF